MLPRVSHIKSNDAEYLLLSGNDLISNTLFRQGHWEQHLLSISKIFYHGIEAPVVIDIGANLGAYSIPIAIDVQKYGGMVIGFEPQRIIYYQLCANIFLNRLENYFAHNQAVGSFDGTIEMPEIDYNINHNIGAFSLDKNYRELHGIESSLKAEVTLTPMIKLDSLQISKSPCLIKIDVEGFELDVLKGGVNFLNQHQFPPILFEAWNTDWFAQKKTELVEFFNSIGYVITSINTSDFIAQHPNNSVNVDFFFMDDGTINMNRTK